MLSPNSRPARVHAHPAICNTLPHAIWAFAATHTHTLRTVTVALSPRCSEAACFLSTQLHMIANTTDSHFALHTRS